MAKWLMKSEPSDYSIDDLASDKTTVWTGIRNFQARNFIRDEILIGDQVLFYHSSCKDVGVAGVAEVVSDCYLDEQQFDPTSRYYDKSASRENPKWHVLDVAFVAKAKRLYPLKEMKKAHELQDFVLFKQSRLSIMPVTDTQWFHILDKIQ